MAMIFISHDLAVVPQVADEVLVMQSGGVVEQGTRRDIFSNPQEAYSRHLVAKQLAMANWATSLTGRI